MCRTLLLLASLTADAAAAPSVADTGPPIFALFSNVTSSLAHAYDLKDDQGSQMACVHAYPARSPAVWGGGHRYWALYQAKVGSEFQVRLASSSDLVSWAFRRTLLQNADMPYASRPAPATHDGASDDDDGWIVVTHEQWMRPGSTLPSQLGFKLYYNESQLLAGTHFNSYVAPLSVGAASRLEGTPSLYATTLVQRGGLWMVDADVGFHFNDARGIDQVASGALSSFGPTAVAPSLTRQARADAYDDLFASRGAVGNIGQRAPGTLLGAHLCAQEANVGAMPPTVWADWRVWLYFFGAAEGDVPTGASGNVTMLNVTTHGGSTAFGNPSWTVLPCPGAYAAGHGGGPPCLFVSYFLFGEGAAPGEAGVCAFVQQLPGDA